MGSFPETYNDPKCLGKCYTPDVILQLIVTVKILDF